MAGQYPKLVNKQFNSPINLYSEKNVKEILERETHILKNGALGIDFNNPMIGKPTNLQNSAVLRMLEEEENRKRDGQPGSLKRVAWPPPREEGEEDFVEQPPVQAQGGPILSSKSDPGLQNNQVPSQQPQSPNFQQTPQSPKFEPILSVSPLFGQEKNLYQANPPSEVINKSTVSPHTTPLSPSISKSPVSSSFAKPWTPVSSPINNQFKSVQPPSPISQPSGRVYQVPIQLDYQSALKNTPSSQQTVNHTHQLTTHSTGNVYEIPIQLDYQHITPLLPTLYQAPYEQFQANSKSNLIQLSQINSAIETKSQSSATKHHSPQINASSSAFIPSQSKFTAAGPKSEAVTLSHQPIPKVQTAPPQPQPRQPQLAATSAQAELQILPSQQKPIEPPPSTITLRPQAPVSQAPPPLITSQPATATLRGGKNLRGDLKWPPEDVKEKMEAEKRHIMELQKGPAARPRKNCKDYSTFFAKHALGNTYPGYKIPPGTQFYDHNPVM